jgi:translocator assembly and maintenance protein 41
MGSEAGDRSHGSRSSSPVLSNFNFPSGILFAFAYGSAAFPQHNHVIGDQKQADQKPQSPSQRPESKMMDVVLVVRDSLTWHQENLTRNPSHYSLLFRIAGADLITWCQRKVKAHIYYNVVQDTRISISSSSSNNDTDSCTSIKYGVIEYNDLIRDLTTWNCLYVAGRMHKPIHVLHEDDSGDLRQAIQMNRRSAVAASLLLLMTKEKILTLDDLLYTVTGLSYTGDFRMIIGEDKSKVKKIVSCQRQLLKDIYLPILRDMLQGDRFQYFEESDQMSINFSDRLIIRLLQAMPATISESIGGIDQWSMMMFGNKDTLIAKVYEEQGQQQITHHHKQMMSFWLNKAISNIVWSSSIRQSVKGFLTVGFVNALNYVRKKMGKMLSSIS